MQEQDALIAEMQSDLERHNVRQQRLSTDTCRSSDDDDVERTDMLDEAVGRNIDIDSAVIERELSDISEPLSVSI